MIHTESVAPILSVSLCLTKVSVCTEWTYEVRIKAPQTMGMIQLRFISRQARYVKNAWHAAELSESRKGKGARYLVSAKGDQRPKFSTKRY
jgi:hypothetical protein